MNFEMIPQRGVPTALALCQHEAAPSPRGHSPKVTHMLRCEWGQGPVGSCRLDVLGVSDSFSQLRQAGRIPYSVESLVRTSQVLSRII